MARRGHSEQCARDSQRPRPSNASYQGLVDVGKVVLDREEVLHRAAHGRTLLVAGVLVVPRAF